MLAEELPDFISLRDRRTEDDLSVGMASVTERSALLGIKVHLALA